MNAYQYTTERLVSKYALSEWTFKSFRTCETRVLPDGCRDFIVKTGDNNQTAWFVSELIDASYTVQSSAGEELRGIRLRPGVHLQQDQLASWLEGKAITDLFDSDRLDEFCIQSDNLKDALACLASGMSTVSCVAKELGVSHRSLQRLVKSGTGQTPSFWFSLARVRRAGQRLRNTPSLSDLAVEFGFSDQAHMNREMKKWFCSTPNQIRANEELNSLLLESGFASEG